MDENEKQAAKVLGTLLGLMALKWIIIIGATKAARKMAK